MTRRARRQWVAKRFRYFELIDEVAQRFEFWEIALEDNVVEQRGGPVGTAGHADAEHHRTAEAAQRDFAHRIELHRELGFVECDDRRLDRRIAELEAAIAADPDDVANYLVYADWIQTLGDPRGSLIVAHIEAARDRRAQPRADAVLAAHRELFLGPFADHVGYDGAPLRLTWRYGFIRELAVDGRFLRLRDYNLLASVIGHPSLRWLETLRIVIPSSDDSARIQRIIDTLATTDWPSVRTLAIGDIGWLYNRLVDDEFMIGIDTWWADVGPLWRRFPNLRHLIVGGDPVELGTLAFPELTHLELDAATIPYPAAAAIANARCPRLTRIDLRYRGGRGIDTIVPPTTHVEQLEGLLASPRMRQLTRLGVTGLPNGDELIARLITLGELSLRELDLVRCQLTTRGVELLAGSRLRLDILDVSDNALTVGAIRQLQPIASLVIPEERPPPTPRRR